MDCLKQFYLLALSFARAKASTASSKYPSIGVAVASQLAATCSTATVHNGMIVPHRQKIDQSGYCDLTNRTGL